MYIADTFNLAIRKVTPDGTLSTYYGTLNAKGNNDGGLAINAAIGAPSDVFVDPAGNVLFPDFVFDRVREVLTTLPSVPGESHQPRIHSSGRFPLRLIKGVNICRIDYRNSIYLVCDFEWQLAQAFQPERRHAGVAGNYC